MFIWPWYNLLYYMTLRLNYQRTEKFEIKMICTIYNISRFLSLSLSLSLSPSSFYLSSISLYFKVSAKQEIHILLSLKCVYKEKTINSFKWRFKWLWNKKNLSMCWKMFYWNEHVLIYRNLIVFDVKIFCKKKLRRLLFMIVLQKILLNMVNLRER